MKSLRTILAAGAWVTVGALFGPTFATATAEKVKEVIVINEDSIPVALQGTPTVNVGGTPSVRVDELPAVAQAGTPVQFQGEFVFSGTRDDFTDAYTVPAGKRLRIDQITFEDDTPAVVERLRINTIVNGVFVRHRIATRPQGANGDVATERVSLYADPQTDVHFYVRLDRPLGSATTGFLMIPTFSGVLLDA